MGHQIDLAALSEHGGFLRIFFPFITLVIKEACSCIVLLCIIVRLRSLLSHLRNIWLAHSYHFGICFQLLANSCSFLAWSLDYLLSHLLLDLLS